MKEWNSIQFENKQYGKSKIKFWRMTEHKESAQCVKFFWISFDEYFVKM